MKRLSHSEEKPNTTKKKRYDDEFNTFLDEESVKLGTLRVQNRELFCKLKQQNNDIQRLTANIRLIKERRRQYDQYLALIDKIWGGMLTLDLASSTVDKNINTRPLSKILQSISLSTTKEDTDGTEIPVKSKSREPENIPNKTKPRDIEEIISPEIRLAIDEHSQNSRVALAHLVNLLLKEKAAWSIARQMLRTKAAGISNEKITTLSAENQKFDQNVKSLETREIHQSKKLSDLEEDLLVLRCRLKEKTGLAELVRGELENRKNKLARDQRHVLRLQNQLRCDSGKSDDGTKEKKSEISEFSELFPKDSGAGNATGAEEITQLQMELKNLVKIANNRQTFIDKLREEKTELLNKSKTQISEIGITLERIRDSAIFRQMERRAECAESECHGIRKDFEEISRDLSEVQAQRRYDIEQHTKLVQSQQKTQEQKVIMVEAKLKKIISDRDSLTCRLQKSRSEIPKQEILQKLSSEITHLETQIGKEREQKIKLKEQVFALKKQVTILEKKVKETEISDELAESEFRCYSVKSELEDQKKQLDEISIKEKKWHAREHELKILIELYQKNVQKENVEAVILLASEKAARQEAEVLQQQLHQYQNGRNETEYQKKMEVEMEKQTEKYQEMFRQYEKYKKEVSELSEKLDAQQQENENLILEIGVIEGEFNAKDEETAKFAKQLAEAEDTNVNLISERIKLTQVQNCHQRKNEILTEKLSKAEQKFSAQEELLRQCQQKIQNLEEQLTKLNEELRTVVSAAELRQLIVRDLGAVTTELRTLLEDAEKELARLRDVGVDAVTSLERERAQALYLSEECHTLKRRIGLCTKNGKGADPFQEEQLNHYKKLVRCSACNDRLKNSVITRCYHVFCRECINQQNPRKCPYPNCGTSFSEKDVHNIYI